MHMNYSKKKSMVKRFAGTILTSALIVGTCTLVTNAASSNFGIVGGDASGNASRTESQTSVGSNFMIFGSTKTSPESTDIPDVTDLIINDDNHDEVLSDLQDSLLELGYLDLDDTEEEISEVDTLVAYLDYLEDYDLATFEIKTEETMEYGSTDDDVMILQWRLAQLGFLHVIPNGIFDEDTQEALKAFQFANGFDDPNGIVDEETKLLLNGDPVAGSHNEDALLFTRTLGIGMTGDDVFALQSRLIDLGFMSGVPDGEYGNLTQEAVNSFQAAYDLEITNGSVDRETINAINALLED